MRAWFLKHRYLLPWVLLATFGLIAIKLSLDYVQTHQGEKAIASATKFPLELPIRTSFGPYTPPEAGEATLIVKTALFDRLLNPDSGRLHEQPSVTLLAEREKILELPARFRVFEVTGEIEGINQFGTAVRSKFTVIAAKANRKVKAQFLLPGWELVGEDWLLNFGMPKRLAAKDDIWRAPEVQTKMQAKRGAAR